LHVSWATRPSAVGLARCFESLPPSRAANYQEHARACPDFAGLAASEGFAKALATQSKVQESACSGGSGCANCPMRGKCGKSQPSKRTDDPADRADRAAMKKTRRAVQLGFLAITLLGVFVVAATPSCGAPSRRRVALRYATEGVMICSLGTTNFCVLGAVLVMALLARRLLRVSLSDRDDLGMGPRVGGRVGIPRFACPQGSIGCSACQVCCPGGDPLVHVAAGELLSAATTVLRASEPARRRHRVWAYVAAGAILVFSLVLAIPFCRWVVRWRRRSAPLPPGPDADQAKRGILPPVRPLRERLSHGDSRGPGARGPRCALPLLHGLHPGLPTERRRDLLGAAPLVGRKCRSGCWWACCWFAQPGPYRPPTSIPSRRSSRAAARRRPRASVSVKVENLTCAAGPTSSFVPGRDDLDAIPGYLKVEHGRARSCDARITYDPAQAGEHTIHRAITEPYYNWRRRVGGNRRSAWRATTPGLRRQRPLGKKGFATTQKGSVAQPSWLFRDRLEACADSSLRSE